MFNSKQIYVLLLDIVIVFPPHKASQTENIVGGIY